MQFMTKERSADLPQISELLKLNAKQTLAKAEESFAVRCVNIETGVEQVRAQIYATL